MRPCSALSCSRSLSLLALGTLLLGCSDPDDPPSTGDGTGSSSGGSDVGETDPATTPPADSTVGPDTDEPTDGTGPGDAPPVIDSFTVDGSTMPGELQSSGMVAIDVDATDDVAIDRVEIYDGEELVATLPSQPYQTELLLSSIDNGTHSYTAVAYDSIGQTATSEVVALSVNVIGGEMLVLRENIGEVQVNFLGVGGPKLGTVSTGGVVVTGCARLDAVPTTGLFARGYDVELSSLWSRTHVPTGNVENLEGFSAPTASTTDPVFLVGGIEDLGANVGRYSVFAVDQANGDLDAISNLWTGSILGGYAPTAAAMDGEVFSAASANELARFSSDFSMEIWRADPAGTAVLDATPTPSGGVAVVYGGNGDCAIDSTFCVRSLTADGDTQWTRQLSSENSLGAPTRAAVSPDGHVAVATPEVEGIKVVIHDDLGDEVSTFVIVDTAGGMPFDLVFGPTGSLVVVGRDPAVDAWAAIVEEDGTVVWAASYTIGATESLATGVAFSSGNRLYLSGGADSFGPGFLTSGWNAWVAEVSY